MKTIINLISTLFYLGKIKKMPGTLGSAAAFLLLPFMTTNLMWLWIIGLMFLVGLFASDAYSIIHAKKDPKEVIIDEFVAQLLTFYIINFFIKDATIHHFFASFLLFRFFDILKPWPICILDKKIGGGFGIMIDDIAAAIVASAIVIVVFMVKTTFGVVYFNN